MSKNGRDKLYTFRRHLLKLGDRLLTLVLYVHASVYLTWRPASDFQMNCVEFNWHNG